MIDRAEALTETVERVSYKNPQNNPMQRRLPMRAVAAHRIGTTFWRRFRPVSAGLGEVIAGGRRAKIRKTTPCKGGCR
jgi:hypothetical protein